jgi:TRAP-type C4-dicarboxylate transport system substrate-binding protein
LRARRPGGPPRGLLSAGAGMALGGPPKPAQGHAVGHPTLRQRRVCRACGADSRLAAAPGDGWDRQSIHKFDILQCFVAGFAMRLVSALELQVLGSCRKPIDALATAPGGCHAVLRLAPNLLLLLVALLCAVLAPASAETHSLRLGLPIAVDSPSGQNIREFARQVQARTGIAIKIELQGKDGRYDERGIVSAVATGALEMGATPLNQFIDDVPLASAFQQPFLLNFDALVEGATMHESEVRGIFDTATVAGAKARILWLQPYGSSIVVSRTTPAANPASIASRVVGVADFQTRELLRVCGGTPVPVSPASIFVELKNGKIEAAAADIMNVREHDLWRVADTITNLRHAPSLYMVVINEKAWQRLSPTQRETFAELAQDAHGYMWARFATIRAQAYEFAAQKGMRIVEPDSDDVAAWRACSAPLLEAFMERAGPAGSQFFLAYGRLRTQPCCRDAPAEASFLRH